LAFATIDDGSTQAAGRFSTVYAVNTVERCCWLAAGGFVFIPRVAFRTLGIERLADRW
jgi:hypothetical protein